MSSLRVTFAFPRRQRGLTLVELMVTMLVSSLIMAGVLTLMVNNSRAVSIQEEIGFIQENARFATELLSREIRMAGHFGCGTGGNVANTVEEDVTDLLSAGLRGFDHQQADSAWPQQIASVKNPGSDAFTVIRGDLDETFYVENHNGVSAVVHLSKQHGFVPGEIMVMADSSCRQASIFAISGPTNSGGNASHVVHNTGNTGGFRNCSRMLWGSFDCADCNQSGNNCGPGASGKSYGKGSELMALIADVYYIAPSAVDPQLPALHRQRLSGAGNPPSEELVAGVEALRILYGLDLNNDGHVDRYLPARDIAANSAAETADNIAWDRVTSVKLSMVLRSFGPVHQQSEAVTLAGGLEFDDRYMRQLISTTVRVRNTAGGFGP